MHFRHSVIVALIPDPVQLGWEKIDSTHGMLETLKFVASA